MKHLIASNWLSKCTIYTFFGISMVLGCDRSDCPRYIQIPASFIPKIAEFHVGDTINIVSKFHQEEVLAFDSEQNEVGFVDVSGFNLRPATTIFRTDTLGQVGITTVHKYFKFIDNPIYDYKLNVVSEEFSILEGSYNFNNDSFDLSYKFIACKAGTFFLRQVSHTSNVEEQHFKDKCPGLNVDIWVNMNSLENYPGNNIELLTESPDPHYNTDLLANPKSQFYHFGGYCFKVLP